MNSRANDNQGSEISALFLIMLTATLLGVSILGPASLSGYIARFGIPIWGAILVFTFLIFRQIPGSDGLRLVQALVVLTGIGSLLNDALEVPFDYVGGLIWGAVLLVSFLFGLIFFAQFILPVTGSEGWTEGFRMLGRRYGLSVASPQPEHLSLPQSFEQLGAGVLPSYQVFALTKGTGFSRPAGPGLVMIYRDETVTSVIDLRNHLRTQPVEAITRDGIPIETKVSVIFRIRRSERGDLNHGLQHPYDRDAIFAASYVSSIDEQGNLRPWTEHPCPLAAAMLANELARYSLNELYQADDTGLSVAEDIKQSIQRQLQRAVEGDGIEILSVSFSQLILPEPISQQRVRTWQADWKRKIKMNQASSNVEALRQIEQARAKSQIEIIDNITQKIQTMRQAGDSDLTDIILLRMLEVVERAATDETIKTLVPQQLMTQMVLDSSTKLQAWVDQPSQETES